MEAHMIRYARLSVFLLGGTWLWCFSAFVIYIVFLPQTTQPVTDAAVVLTGRRGRIAEGNAVVQQGLARKLFISGIHEKVRPADLSSNEHATPEGMGYMARNTAQNADEIAGWQANYGWASIRLVTDAVHMPRSLWHVRRTCPNLQVVPHAVYPPTLLRTYVHEFHKFAYNVVLDKFMKNTL
jgi:uncharacterized SAM-binding protein YcdF (DUF218 family)